MGFKADLRQTGFASPFPGQAPQTGLKLSRSGGNLGPWFLVVLVVVGFVIWRTVFGFDPLPWLRGMQIGLPLVCFLVGALVVVLWAGKFFSTK